MIHYYMIPGPVPNISKVVTSSKKFVSYKDIISYKDANYENTPSRSFN